MTAAIRWPCSFRSFTMSIGGLGVRGSCSAAAGRPGATRTRLSDENAREARQPRQPDWLGPGEDPHPEYDIIPRIPAKARGFTLWRGKRGSARVLGGGWAGRSGWRAAGLVAAGKHGGDEPRRSLGHGEAPGL